MKDLSQINVCQLTQKQFVKVLQKKWLYYYKQCDKKDKIDKEIGEILTEFSKGSDFFMPILFGYEGKKYVFAQIDVNSFKGKEEKTQLVENIHKIRNADIEFADGTFLDLKEFLTGYNPQSGENKCPFLQLFEV